MSDKSLSERLIEAAQACVGGPTRDLLLEAATALEQPRDVKSSCLCGKVPCPGHSIDEADDLIDAALASPQPDSVSSALESVRSPIKNTLTDYFKQAGGVMPKAHPGPHADHIIAIVSAALTVERQGEREEAGVKGGDLAIEAHYAKLEGIRAAKERGE